MADITCRCGETLKVSSSDPERVTCPHCGAKIRVRRSPKKQEGLSPADDGFVRFKCPCGRRLKVRVEQQPEAGKCPDCGRIVPVPESAQRAIRATAQRAGVDDQNGGTDAGMHTVDMDVADLEHLDQWSRRHQANKSQ
jgi:hypothetical protein